jgi:hypothetical protein
MSGNRPFIPNRAASWWCTLEDLMWPEKQVVDRIKRRAEGFAEAGIDTAINFGFHLRFDFSDYFGSLHGYYAQVCEELHKYGIRFMDHYSCNFVTRPRGEAEFRKVHASHRHHILLHPDPVAAAHAQYAGHRFHDLCEIDVRDGSRGYSLNYQAELFCHNNPAFLDMHAAYLRRLLDEVPVDGLQIDDMCDYAGLTTCACPHCLERFRRDYGRELPPFGDESFWGDTSGAPSTWGNYDNPAFRDWLQCKSDGVVDHLRMIKSIVGDLPLMTCCSSTGPMALDKIGLDLEKMMPQLDLLMLENCGLGTDTVRWDRMDAEALQQKDIAAQMGGAPAVALSYTVYEHGAYLGWCLSRFWGVGNWCSTLNGRLPEDPDDAKDVHELIGEANRWEKAHSDLPYWQGRDVPEVRLVSSRFCRVNGWRDADGREQWDRVSDWSKALVRRSVGYRFVRAGEFADADALRAEDAPLVLDGVACVSDRQFAALRTYLQQGGRAWLRLPFGTHDETGALRPVPLSESLASAQYPGLLVLPDLPAAESLEALIGKGAFAPRIRRLSGDAHWALRLRVHPEGIALHAMSLALEAEAHPTLKDGYRGEAVMSRIRSAASGGKLECEIDLGGLGAAWSAPVLKSPELGGESRPVACRPVSAEGGPERFRLTIDMSGITVYGVVQ